MDLRFSAHVALKVEVAVKIVPKSTKCMKMLQNVEFLINLNSLIKVSILLQNFNWPKNSTKNHFKI